MFGGDFGYMKLLEKSRCCTAWVGQLPPQTTKQEVMDLFKDFAPLCCRVVTKVRLGSKENRFAFVYFEDEEIRDLAIAAKRHGSTIRGHPVIVNRSFNAFEGPRLGGKSRYDFDLAREVNY